MGSAVSVPPQLAIYQAACADRLDDIKNAFVDDFGEQTPARCLDWEDEQGYTALSIAAREGRAACVRLLLELGANCRHSSRRHGRGTALHVALGSPTLCVSVIDCLILNGANPFEENAQRMTPWEMAAAKGEPNILRKFEKQKAFFAHQLRVKIHGDTAQDRRRWVCVLPRYAYRSTGVSYQTLASTSLYVFDSIQSTVPGIKMNLRCIKKSTIRRTASTVKVYLCPVSNSESPYRAAKMEFVFDMGVDNQLLLNHFLEILHKNTNVQPVWQRDDMDSDVDMDSASDVCVHREERREGARSDRIQNSATAARSEPSSFSNSRSFHWRQHPEWNGIPVVRHKTLLHRFASGPLPHESSEKRKADEIGLQDRALLKIRSHPWDKGHGNSGRCVICLERPQEAGFVHGSSMHRCICRQCVRHFEGPEKGKCPICRRAIEHVVTDFY